jgi:anhydro-N-acetylmuramic acid kinase
MKELYIGLMSGTSLDGADVVIVDFSGERSTLLSAVTTPFPQALTERLRALVRTPVAPLQELGALDSELGSFFANCVKKSVAATGLDPTNIVAIGHSGHTVFHKPQPPSPFTMQLGDPSVVAATTDIDTIFDFRRMDVALGGQGAPLVPLFHEWQFAATEEVRVVLNLGGIANITVLDPGKPVIGFDTGPANSLMDAWCRRCWSEPFDNNGARARSGEIIPSLLRRFLDDPYFHLKAPKSTGFEHFNLSWIEDKIAEVGTDMAHTDILTTLAELTAVSASDAIRDAALDAQRVILCGGGSYNRHLSSRLGALLPGCAVESSAEFGLEPAWVEAVAFAWLARQRIKRLPGNAPAVTGARHSTLLGSIYSIHKHE